MDEQAKITCRINGMDYSFPKGATLEDFLKTKNLPAGAVVIELNKRVLQKGQYDGIVLANGDTLEIIQVIGGG